MTKIGEWVATGVRQIRLDPILTDHFQCPLQITREIGANRPQHPGTFTINLLTPWFFNSNFLTP